MAVNQLQARATLVKSKMRPPAAACGLGLAAFLWRARASRPASLTVVAEWVEVDFDWATMGLDRARAIADGTFIPEHNAVTGLKVCGPGVAVRCVEKRIFATVPRWATGVLATLNEVVSNASGQAVLRAWPSVDSQDPRDCSAIQYVQSMEIDPHGVMWVVDVGRKYFNDPHNFDNSCHPKMVLIDVPTGSVLESYTFPDSVAPPTGSFLNDLVLDLPHDTAYISDTGNNVTDRGGLVVFDRARRRSRRFEDVSTRCKGTAAIAIHGRNYTGRFPFPTDGIALSPPDVDRLYYSPLGDYMLYSLSASALRDFSSSPAEVRRTVRLEELKPSISDGVTCSDEGVVLYGGLTDDSLWRWVPGTPSKPPQVVATDSERLWWIDTFSWDNLGAVYFTTNKLDRYFFGGMDFSGRSGPNFRIVKVDLGMRGYLKGQRWGRDVAGEVLLQ